MVFLAGTGTATIGWGNGSTTETVTLSASASGYTHSFSGTNSRTIAIDGENITGLNCYFSHLTSLDVSKNTALTYLAFVDNRLTNLDVNKNTALQNLWCINNKLTAAGLNSLLGSLYANAGSKKICVTNNPGTIGCDRTIATAKGWTLC